MSSEEGAAAQRQPGMQIPSGEISYRKVFGISRADTDQIIEAAMEGSVDDVNARWADLGQRLGFVWTTVREVVGGNIADDDPWLITAEVERVLPDANPAQVDDDPVGWPDRVARALVTRRFSLADAVILFLLGAMIGTGEWIFAAITVISVGVAVAFVRAAPSILCIPDERGKAR